MIEYILEATVRYATPLLLVALGEIIAERAGVINIGLEGMMILGAFTGWLSSFYIQGMNPSLAPWLGILFGGLSGVILASIFGSLVLWLKTDQVVTGTGINLLAFRTCRGVVPSHLWRNRGRTEGGNLPTASYSAVI